MDDLEKELEELEKYFESEATEVMRENEVERILKAFKLNPFEQLDLAPEATERFLSSFIN